MSVATLIEFDNFGIPLDLRCFLIGQARVMIDESWLDVKYPSTENPVGKKNITRKSFFFFFLFSELQPSHYSFLKTGKKKKKNIFPGNKQSLLKSDGMNRPDYVQFAKCQNKYRPIQEKTQDGKDILVIANDKIIIHNIHDKTTPSYCWQNSLLFFAYWEDSLSLHY